MWSSLLLQSALLVSIQAADPEALYQEGIERYNAGDFEEAVELLSRAARFRSNVPDYRYHLGLAYLKVGKPKEAAREIESTLGMIGMKRETRVKEPMVLVQAAIAYLALGNLKAARERAELALRRDESSPNGHYVVGLVERDAGDDAKAMEHFAAALEIDRDHPEANVALAEWIEVRGQLDEARENLRHASHGTDDNFEILMALGSLAHQSYDHDEASEAFELAHAQRPGDDGASYNLGTLRFAQGRFDDAIELLSPLVMRKAPHDAAAFNLAQALREKGEVEEARAMLAALLESDPDFEGASFSMGLVAEQAGDKGAAEKAYREAMRTEPLFLPAFLNLAALLEHEGRLGDATEVLRAALAIDMEEKQAEAIREAIASIGKQE